MKLLCCLLIFFISGKAFAQTETVVTVNIDMTFTIENKPVTKDVLRGYLRCYHDYIVERIFITNPKKYKSPADIKPPFYNDSCYYLINTASNKFVRFNVFSDTAQSTAAQDVAMKPLGVQMLSFAALDSAVRITDTLNHIRYRVYRKNFEFTAYLSADKNPSPYSFHKKIEQEAQGRFVMVEHKNLTSGTLYLTQIQYTTRKVPPKELAIIHAWIAKTKW